MDRVATEFFRLGSELVDALLDRELMTRADSERLRLTLQRAVESFAATMRALNEDEAAEEYDAEGDAIMWAGERVVERDARAIETEDGSLVERAAELEPSVATADFALARATPGTLDANFVQLRSDRALTQALLLDDEYAAALGRDGARPLLASSENLALWKRYAATADVPANALRLRALDAFFEPSVNVYFSPRDVAGVLALDELFRHLGEFLRGQVRAFEARLADSLRERNVTEARTREIRAAVDELDDEVRQLRAALRVSPAELQREHDELTRRVARLDAQRVTLLNEIEERASATPRDAAYVRFVVSAYVAKETRFLEYLIAVLRNRHSGRRLLGRMQQHNAFVSRAGFHNPEIIAHYLGARDEALRALYALV